MNMMMGDLPGGMSISMVEHHLVVLVDDKNILEKPHVVQILVKNIISFHQRRWCK